MRRRDLIYIAFGLILGVCFFAARANANEGARVFFAGALSGLAATVLMLLGHRLLASFVPGAGAESDSHAVWGRHRIMIVMLTLIILVAYAASPDQEPAIFGLGLGFGIWLAIGLLDKKSPAGKETEQ